MRSNVPDSESLATPVVLLVQSPDDSRDMYAEFFDHHGFSVVCPLDAADALKLARTADVIITGIQIPGEMDGFGLMTRLRGDEATKEKPIIVVTSWAWQTERLRAEDAGCDVFLTKPCLPDELLRHVRRVLRSTRLRAIRGKSVKRDAIGETSERARRLPKQRDR